MATVVIHCDSNAPGAASSIKNYAQVRVTYTAGNGSISITKVEGTCTDTYGSWRGGSGSSHGIKLTIGGSSSSWGNATVKFGPQSNYYELKGDWDASAISKSVSGLSGSTSVVIETWGSTYAVGTFTGSIDAGTYVYPQPGSVTVNSVSTGVGTATVSASVSGTYTSIQYSKDGSNWQSSNSFSGLTHNTSYTFYARACNNNSGWKTSSGKSATIGGNAPTLNSVTSSPSRTGASFSVNASYDTNASYSKTQYSTNNSSWVDGGSVGNLTPNTSYTYYVRVVDNWGRASGSKSTSFTTTGNKPSITEVSKGVYRDKCDLGLTVSYDTNASYNAISIKYGTSSSYGSTSSTSTMNNLSPNTTYHYSVQVKDNWGRWSNWTSDATFKTSAYLPSSLIISMSNIII